MRWANVQAIDVKFAQDLTHQKLLKSVNFWQSYLKNKNVDIFLGDSVLLLIEMLSDFFNRVIDGINFLNA